ncbi:MAG: hypothetical protein HZB55_11010 [Deltaproteobacteria bacterium]|nr:hypothetical protein [Deltaproteobacteria bacterium]
MKPGKILATALTMVPLLLLVPACQKKEGPVERAGKAVDSALDKAGQQVEKAGDKIEDASKR